MKRYIWSEGDEEEITFTSRCVKCGWTFANNPGSWPQDTDDPSLMYGAHGRLLCIDCWADEPKAETV